MRSTLSCRLCASLRSHGQSKLAKLRSTPLSRHIEISEEVQDALHRSQAVISLETAITTHGLPYEQAISTTKSLNDILRKGGAVPAVIGLIDGVIKIGLSDNEIERLADPSAPSGREKWKVGKRDIAPALVKGVDGGTTVSATSFLSKLAGIDIFVTGGIGGVHRGATETMDISSDLTELGRTSTTVVCAGAKSILDIGLTLEYLETLGVTVTTFGPTKDFPAFYARQSGFESPSNVRSAPEAAKLIYLSKMLKTKTGTLIGVPIPAKYEEKSIAIQKAVEQAVREAEENGIAKRGKEVTPWILAKVKEITGGESVESNIALIENNARVGAAISVELTKLVQSGISNTNSPHLPASMRSPSNDMRQDLRRIAVIGAAAVDIVSKPEQMLDSKVPGGSGLLAGTTVPGDITLRLGGVARNVHEAAFKLGASDAILIAPVGRRDDPLATILEEGLKTLGASTDGLIPKSGQTPSVNLILDGNGSLQVGVAATQLVESLQGDEIVSKLREVRPEIVCLDGNLSEEAIATVLDYCSAANITTAFEPTSDAKALKILTRPTMGTSRSLVTHFTPNLQEVNALARQIRKTEPNQPLDATTAGFGGVCPAWISHADMEDITLAMKYTQYLWLKGGARGLCIFHYDDNGKLWCRPFDALPIKTVKNSVGAGDSLMGGILAGLAQGIVPSPFGILTLADLAQRAAVATLASDESVGSMREVREWLATKAVGHKEVSAVEEPSSLVP